MTNYPAEYEAALKYEMVPESEVKQFVDAHHNGDTDALGVLRDRLMDSGDPRGTILERALGHTQFPADTKGFGHLPIRRPLLDDLQVGSYDEGTSNRFSFYPHPDHETPSVAVYWTHSQRNPKFDHSKNWRLGDSTPAYRDVDHTAYFTPQEAAHLANLFPDEHAQQIHNVLRHHFPDQYRESD